MPPNSDNSGRGKRRDDILSGLFMLAMSALASSPIWITHGLGESLDSGIRSGACAVFRDGISAGVAVGFCQADRRACHPECEAEGERAKAKAREEDPCDRRQAKP